MPPVASTDSAKPALTAEPGVDEQQDQDGDAEAPRPARSTVAAHADQRDRAHRRRPHDARLGPGDHHEADDPDRRQDMRSSGPAPRSTARRSAGSRPASVRLVPLTASRWVSPVVRKSSATSGRDRRRRRRPAPGPARVHRRPGRRPPRGRNAVRLRRRRHQTPGSPHHRRLRPTARSAGRPRRRPRAPAGRGAGCRSQRGGRPVVVGQHHHRHGGPASAPPARPSASPAPAPPARSPNCPPPPARRR